MTLQISEIKLLQEALLAAFDRQSMTMMIYYGFEKDFENLVPGGLDFEEQVFELLRRAKREEWIDDLVHTAHDDNPGNSKLKEFCGNYVRYRGDKPSLEKVLSNSSSLLDVNRWRTALEKLEHQVCQIKIDDDPKGTGFLINDDLVMTNFHVINGLLGDSPSFTPDQVDILFDFKKLEGNKANPGVSYKLVSSKWLIDSSPFSDAEGHDNFDVTPQLNELDFAVLRLAPNDTVPGKELIVGSKYKVRGFVEFPKDEIKFKKKSPVFILQHPKGAHLKMAIKYESTVSINENRTRIRHKTDTEEGSSGSPCFDSSWNLIALHHAGGPTKAQKWNQAVPVSTIREHWEKNDMLEMILGQSNGDGSSLDGNDEF